MSFRGTRPLPFLAPVASLCHSQLYEVVADLECASTALAQREGVQPFAGRTVTKQVRESVEQLAGRLPQLGSKCDIRGTGAVTNRHYVPHLFNYPDTFIKGHHPHIMGLESPYDTIGTGYA